MTENARNSYHNCCFGQKGMWVLKIPTVEMNAFECRTLTR